MVNLPSRSRAFPPDDLSPPRGRRKEGTVSSCRGEQKKGTTRDREVTCSHVDATVLHRAYKSRHKTRVQPGADLFRTAIGLGEPEEKREQERERENVSRYWFARSFSRSLDQRFHPRTSSFFCSSDGHRTSIDHPFECPRSPVRTMRRFFVESAEHRYTELATERPRPHERIAKGIFCKAQRARGVTRYLSSFREISL